jgi:hypothetical protein
MARRNPQTMAKRAREQAVKERRELKREKKAQRAAAKEGGLPVDVAGDDTLPPADGEQAEPPADGEQPEPRSDGEQPSPLADGEQPEASAE